MATGLSSKWDEKKRLMRERCDGMQHGREMNDAFIEHVEALAAKLETLRLAGPLKPEDVAPILRESFTDPLLNNAIYGEDANFLKKLMLMDCVREMHTTKLTALINCQPDWRSARAIKKAMRLLAKQGPSELNDALTMFQAKSATKH